MCFRGRVVVILIGVAATCHAATPQSDSSGKKEAEAAGILLFGSSEIHSNYLACTFFDLERARNGGRLSTNQEGVNRSLIQFMQAGWQPSRLARYYRSPVKRYARAVMIPPVECGVVLSAFGEEAASGNFSLVMYEGTLLHPAGITFRFRGSADEEIMVRVGDRVVFGDSFESSETGTAGDFTAVWKSSDKQTGKYYLGNNTASVGDWITLKPGIPVDIQIVVAEGSGDVFSALLVVEVEGVRYPQNKQGGPILPPFKMDTLSLDLQDQICIGLPEGDAALEGGPAFHGGGWVVSSADTAVRHNLKLLDESSGSGLRIWTGDNGKVLEARFDGMSGSMVVLKDAAGRKRRIPIKRLSRDDQVYIELVHTMEYAITFEGGKRVQESVATPNPNPVRRARGYEYIFEATAKQIRSAKRTHDLVGELYVLTRELKGDACILVAREELSFTSQLKAGTSRIITTDPITVLDEVFGDASREEDDFIYLFTLKDADGAVISHSATEPWLFPNLGSLQQLPVGAYMDPSCNRVRPTRPKPTRN